MKKPDSPRGLLNQELETVEWSQRDTLAVLRAADQGGHQSMKATMKLALTMMLALVFLTTTAMAATILFSPRYNALQLANQALLDKYGVTDEMLVALHHTIDESEDVTIVTYRVVMEEVLRENRFGEYTVTIRNGKAEALWSLEGMDTSGGLDAPAWGVEQLRMYALNWGDIMSYMESRGMLMNAPQDDAVWQQREDKQAQDKQTALEMAKLSLSEAAAIGREAVAIRYDLNEQQAALLMRYTEGDGTGFYDESTYKMVDGCPLVNLYFHLTQNSGYMRDDGYYEPGEWAEKDGIYVVTVNLLDGAVEDIIYDNGLMGNG